MKMQAKERNGLQALLQLGYLPILCVPLVIQQLASILGATVKIRPMLRIMAMHFAHVQD